MSIITLPSNPAEVPELTKAFQAPPEALHSGQFDYASFDGNAAIKLMADTVGEAWNEGGTINELRQNPHEEDKASTADRKVRELVESSQHRFGDKFDRAKAGLVAELKRVESDLETKAGLKPNMAIANLIVGTLQGMKNDAERMAAVNGLLEDGDYVTLATLLAVPRFTTQLPADFLIGLRERALRKVDPKGVALRDQLKLCIDRADNAGNASIVMFAKLRAGAEQGAWRTRAQQAAVHAARETYIKR